MHNWQLGQNLQSPVNAAVVVAVVVVTATVSSAFLSNTQNRASKLPTTWSYGLQHSHDVAINNNKVHFQHRN